MPSETDHIVIVGPGLGDSNWFLERGVKSWANYGIQTEVREAPWSCNDYEVIKQSLEERIAHHRRQGRKVAFVGISASASFIGTPGLSAGINICGRLMSDQNNFFLQNMVEGKNQAHKQAVKKFEHEIEPEMSDKNRQKILIIRPIWDDTVPVKAMLLRGAFEQEVKMVGHVPSIYYAVYKGAPEICRFLNERLRA